MRRYVVALGVMVTLYSSMGLLVACGDSGPTAEEKREARERREAAQERREREKAKETADTCRRQLGKLLNALTTLNGRLGVGLNYATYFEEVGEANVAYQKIPFKQLSLECMGKVGVPSEKALNRYVDAADIWDECFEDLYCDNDAVDEKLNREWLKAGRLVAQARRGLHELAEP